VTVIRVERWRKQPEAWEASYRRALTVQQLMDRLAFCDRKARVYVRNGWIAGVTSTREYLNGVYDQPSVLLYLNPDEVPQ
jgi:hypothetical protein